MSGPIRTVENWRVHLAPKGAQAMAEMIIGDLTGYRSASKWRDDDTRQLTNAIAAIIELTNAARTKP